MIEQYDIKNINGNNLNIDYLRSGVYLEEVSQKANLLENKDTINDINTDTNIKEVSNFSFNKVFLMSNAISNLVNSHEFKSFKKKN